MKMNSKLLAIVTIACLSGFSVACLLTGPFFRGTDQGPRFASAEHVLLPDEDRLVKIFEKVSPSVVFISNDAVRRNFFSLDVQRVPQGTGSGFVWDKQGHIVTNFHVVERADLISVSFDTKTAYRAKVVGIAPDKDLAVLKVEAPEELLHPITVGSSSNLLPGMEAIAIGNPFGLDHSLTRGIISALGREIRSRTGRVIEGVVQTDAAINPGNSGGPLLNSRGDLIGVNTAIVSRSGSSSGIGFAVPVNTVRRVVGQLIKHGRVIRPGLGVYLFSDEIARQWGIRKGVIVRRVVPESAAAEAGLLGARFFRGGEVDLGDIIIGVADREVSDMDDLLNELEEHKIGDEVTVKVQRGRQVREFQVKLQKVE